MEVVVLNLYFDTQNARNNFSTIFSTMTRALGCLREREGEEERIFWRIALRIDLKWTEQRLRNSVLFGRLDREEEWMHTQRYGDRVEEIE